MTKQALNRCLTLRRQLERSRELLASLEAAGLTAEATNVKESISGLEADIRCSEAAVMDWSGGIEDDVMRMIFRLRFLHGMSWETVAVLIGGRNTGRSVRLRYHRYMETHHDE